MAISASYLHGWQIWHRLKKIIVATFLRLSFQGISAFYLRPIRACSLRTQNFESQWTMLMSITSMIQGRHTRELWKVNRKFKQLRLWATHVNRKWYQIIHWSTRTNSVWPFLSPEPLGLICNRFVTLVSLPRDQETTGIGDENAVWPVPYACA